MNFNNYINNIQRKQDLLRIKILQQENNVLNSGAWFLINDLKVTWTSLQIVDKNQPIENQLKDILYYNFHGYIFIKEKKVNDSEKNQANYYILPKKYNDIYFKEWITNNYYTKELINNIDEKYINGFLLPVHTGWSTIVDNINLVRVDANNLESTKNKKISGNTSFIYKNWESLDVENDYILLTNGLQQYCVYDINAERKQIYLTYNKGYNNTHIQNVNEINFFYEKYSNPYYDYITNITNKNLLIPYVDIKNKYFWGKYNEILLNYIGCYYRGLPRHISIISTIQGNDSTKNYTYNYHEIICDNTESENTGNLFQEQNENSNKLQISFINTISNDSILRIY